MQAYRARASPRSRPMRPRCRRPVRPPGSGPSGARHRIPCRRDAEGWSPAAAPPTTIRPHARPRPARGSSARSSSTRCPCRARSRSTPRNATATGNALVQNARRSDDAGEQQHEPERDHAAAAAGRGGALLDPRAGRPGDGAERQRQSGRRGRSAADSGASGTNASAPKNATLEQRHHDDRGARLSGCCAAISGSMRCAEGRRRDRETGEQDRCTREPALARLGEGRADTGREQHRAAQALVLAAASAASTAGAEARAAARIASARRGERRWRARGTPDASADRRRSLRARRPDESRHDPRARHCSASIRGRAGLVVRRRNRRVAHRRHRARAEAPARSVPRPRPASTAPRLATTSPHAKSATPSAKASPDRACRPCRPPATMPTRFASMNALKVQQ